jgi:hypothetical protein
MHLAMLHLAGHSQSNDAHDKVLLGGSQAIAAPVLLVFGSMPYFSSGFCPSLAKGQCIPPHVLDVQMAAPAGSMERKPRG